jgi:hypothetical protein
MVRTRVARPPLGRVLAATLLVLAGLLATAAPRSDATVRMPAGGITYSRTAADQNTTITPEEAFHRAEYWISLGLTYSQTGGHVDLNGTSYRTDCSGFVSMAWHTDNPGFTTMTLDAIGRRIPLEDVQPGDAVNSDGHVALATSTFSPGRGVEVMTFGSTPPVHDTYSEMYLRLNGYYGLRYHKMQVVTDEMVLDELEQRVQRPNVTIQPPNGQTLVNFDTIFYADDTPYHEVIPIGSVQVEVWATPSPFHWHFGDDAELETPDGGEPYPHQTVTHKYANAGAFRPSVDVTWGGIRWQIVDDLEMHFVNETFTLQGAPVDLATIESKSFLGDPGVPAGPSPNR